MQPEHATSTETPVAASTTAAPVMRVRWPRVVGFEKFEWDYDTRMRDTFDRLQVYLDNVRLTPQPTQPNGFARTIQWPDASTRTAAAAPTATAQSVSTPQSGAIGLERFEWNSFLPEYVEPPIHPAQQPAPSTRQSGFTYTIQWPEYRCAMCGSCLARGRKRCSRCKRVRYCSETCHIAHHPRHRTYCIPPHNASATTIRVTQTPPTAEDWTFIVSRLETDQLLRKYHPDHIHLQPECESVEDRSGYNTLAGYAVYAGCSDLFRLLVEAGAGENAGAARCIATRLCHGSSALGRDLSRITCRRECLWIWLHAKRELTSPVCIPFVPYDDLDPLPWVCMWTELAGRAVGDLFDSNDALVAMHHDRAHFEAFRHLVRHGLPIDIPIPWSIDLGETVLSLAEQGRMPVVAAELMADRAHFVNHDAEHLTLDAVASIVSGVLLPSIITLCIAFLF